MIPTNAQTWLLRAALRRGDAALMAWQTWQSLASIEALDEDSTWLLPLLYLNLSSQSLASAERLVRYENVYRHNWYKNHLMLHQARPAIERLQRLGASVTLLGGCALSLAYYDQPGARPFARVTVATRPSTLVSPAASDIACDWKGLALTAPAPAEQLVDICVHRNTWDQRSRLLWLADAATLLRKHPSLDWTQFAVRADQAGQAERVRSALAMVEELCGEPVTA